MNKITKNIVPIAIILAGLLVVGAVVHTKNAECTGAIGSAEVLSEEKAAEKTINYINETLLRGRATAVLVSIAEDIGMYKIIFTVAEQEIESYITKDGHLFFPEVIDMTETEPVAKETGTTIGNFSIAEGDICEEGGKPIIYFFGSESCPHCAWQEPVIARVADKFGSDVSFHNIKGSGEDTEIFQKFSTGGVPTLVLGCRYYRVGSGEGSGEEVEEKNLTALICKLTGSNPGGVCNEVQDLINQIN